MEEEEKLCKCGCGELFITRIPWKLYVNDEHKYRAAHGYDRFSKSGKCKQCGIAVDGQRKMCDECAAKSRRASQDRFLEKQRAKHPTFTLKCVICGEEFKTKRAYMSVCKNPECAKARQHELGLKRERSYKRFCAVCGEQFPTKNPLARTCSPAHAAQHKAQTNISCPSAQPVVEIPTGPAMSEAQRFELLIRAAQLPDYNPRNPWKYTAMLMEGQ